MRIKEISISNQRGAVKLPNGLTLNETPSCELTAELAEGDDVEACSRELREKVEAELAKHEQLIRDVYFVNQKMAEDRAAEANANEQEALRERQRQFLEQARRNVLVNAVVQPTPFAPVQTTEFPAGALKPGTLAGLPAVKGQHIYMTPDGIAGLGSSQIIVDDLDMTEAQDLKELKESALTRWYNERMRHFVIGGKK